MEESSSPKRITTSERIAVHLRAAIPNGEVPRGIRIRQVELAERQSI